jgi:hypothetical protein
MRPEGAKVFHDPTIDGIDWDLIVDLLADPYLFTSTCQIVREDDSVGFVDLTRFQKWMLWSIHEHRWVMVDKFRQAMATTVYVLWLLRDCMYLEGMQGVLIACDEGTAKMAFDRLKFAYERLPDHIKIPLMPGQRGSATEIKFVHGGGVKIISAGSTAPAVGHSVGRMVITEWGEARWQRKAAINLFPTIYRRPHGRLVLESTPGRAGTQHQMMWYEALKGMGWYSSGDDEEEGEDAVDHAGTPLFFPLFLEWWRQFGSEQWVPANFEPDAVEKKLLATCPGMTHGNLMFRRTIMKTLFMGESRLFDSKYPPDPFGGWLGAFNPKLPEEPLRLLMRDAVMDDQCRYNDVVGLYEIEPPTGGWCIYVITADPAGFGEATGDPSAMTVWDALTWKEVAFWEGREDPDVFAERLMRAQKYYCDRRPGDSDLWGGIDARKLIAKDLSGSPEGSVIVEDCLLAPESNKGECIAALRVLGVKSLFWSSRSQPGWYASSKSLRRAEAHTVVSLREGELRPRSFGTLQQCLTYDGSRRDLRVSSDAEGGTHHFDRARCVIIAGDILRLQTNRIAYFERQISDLNRQLGIAVIDGILDAGPDEPGWEDIDVGAADEAGVSWSVKSIDKLFGRKQRW